jgi:cytochrome c oxidase assembly protein subunit 11
LPGETVDMPVFFFIDPDYADDPQLSRINNITLSYTFFQTDEDDDDDEDEDEEDLQQKA